MRVRALVHREVNGGFAVSSPFEVLGVPPRFTLDAEELARRHRELSRALHPDRYVSRPASERREALGRAIAVNEAYRKLKDPLSRAAALLGETGPELQETEQPKASAALLMEVLELREELGVARRAGDRAKLERLHERFQARSEAAEGELARAFAATPVRREAVLESLGNLRYWRRLLEEAALSLDDL